MLAWIASVVLAALSVLLFFTGHGPSDWGFYIADGFLALAAILLFPPLWSGRSGGHIRIIAAVLLTLVAFVIPFKTHAIKLDMPKPSQR